MREMTQVKAMISNQGEILSSGKELIISKRIRSSAQISATVNILSKNHPQRIQFKIS